MNDNLIYCGKICGYVLNKTVEKIKPGVTALELDKFAEKLIEKFKARPAFKNYNGYPNATCISVNSHLVHSIPTNYKIVKNDIVSIDLGVNYKGNITDAAYTKSLSNNTKINKFIRDTQKSLYLAIAESTYGNKISEISKAIESVAKINGYSIAKGLSGHGVGNKLHTDPLIPNYYTKNSTKTLKNNIAIAIEPMFGIKRLNNKLLIETKKMPDKWTLYLPNNILGAHFEHSILINGNKPLILTKFIDRIDEI